MNTNRTTFQYCLRLLDLGSRRCRAMANLVMSLSSSPTVSSVVELTNSLCYYYTYSNITKVLSYWDCDAKTLQSFLLSYLLPHRQLSNGKTYHALTHDFTSLPKPSSPTLEERGFLLTNNPVAGKLGLTSGYTLSCLHYSSGLMGHCPPLSIIRLDGADDKLPVAVKQIKSTIAASVFKDSDHLTLLRTDSYYGCAAFLSPLYECDNLLVVSRLRVGIKVWVPYDGVQKGKRKRRYGACHYLIEQTRTKETKVPKTKEVRTITQHAITTLPPHEVRQMETTMDNGRAVVITTTRWCDLLLRSKGTAKMQDKPFDVLRVEIRDAKTKSLVFKRPMYLTVFGKRKEQMPTQDVQPQYRERYDVEPAYRFAKQKLLLCALQTPDLTHLDRWIKIVLLSWWLLFAFAQEDNPVTCEAWQKHMPKNKAKGQNQKLTIAQAQRTAKIIFPTFDKTRFLPQSTNNGKGRLKGTTFEKRKRHKPKKKAAFKAEKAEKQSQQLPNTS